MKREGSIGMLSTCLQYGRCLWPTVMLLVGIRTTELVWSYGAALALLGSALYCNFLSQECLVPK